MNGISALLRGAERSLTPSTLWVWEICDLEENPHLTIVSSWSQTSQPPNGEWWNSVTHKLQSMAFCYSFLDITDAGSIPGSGRLPGEGNGNLLQYSCMKNPMDKGAWQATIHGVARVRHNLATKPPDRLRHYPTRWNKRGLAKVY